MNSSNHSSEVGQRIEKKQLAKVADFVAKLPIYSLAAASGTIAFEHSYHRRKIDVTGNLLCPVSQSLLLQVIFDAGLKGKQLLRNNPDGRAAEILRRLAADSVDVSTIVGNVTIVTVKHADLVKVTGFTDCRASSPSALCYYFGGLSEVIIKTHDSASRLLAYNLLEDGNFDVALSPCLSDAAQFGGKYAGIRVDERNLLLTDEAKLMHAWLSTKLLPGEQKQFHLRPLAEAVWPYPEGISVPECFIPAIIIQHVELLNNCGWKVSVSDHVATICRPGL